MNVTLQTTPRVDEHNSSFSGDNIFKWLGITKFKTYNACTHQGWGRSLFTEWTYKFQKSGKKVSFFNKSFILFTNLSLSHSNGWLFLKTESRKRVLFKQRCLKVYYTHVKILTKTDPFIFCRQANYIFEHWTWTVSSLGGVMLEYRSSTGCLFCSRKC